MKTKVCYCRKCRKDTVHELVDKDSVLSGNGLARGMLAVASLGFSEVLNTATVTRKYECRKCGEIRNG
jgi:ribosomal protein L44E